MDLIVSTLLASGIYSGSLKQFSQLWRTYLLLIVALVVLVPPGSSYKLSYTDCSSPEALQSYDLHQSCDQRRPPPMKATPWIVAQKIQIQERRGWQCSITYSAFTYKCGVWGHLKTAQVPQIQHSMTVSAPWCRTLVTLRVFIPPGTTESITIQPNTVNIIYLCGDHGNTRIKG